MFLLNVFSFQAKPVVSKNLFVHFGHTQKEQYIEVLEADYLPSKIEDQVSQIP